VDNYEDADMKYLTACDTGLGNVTIGDEDFSFKLPILDMVPDCRVRRCKLFMKCNEDKVEGQPCGLQVKYLLRVTQPFVDAMRFYPDPMFANVFCTQILPMYHQLCLLQMESVVLEDTVYQTRTGMVMVHPVFKEIRQVTTRIEKQLNSQFIKRALYRSSAKASALERKARGEPTQYNKQKTVTISQFFQKDGKPRKDRLRRIKYYSQMSADHSEEQESSSG